MLMSRIDGLREVFYETLGKVEKEYPEKDSSTLRFLIVQNLVHSFLHEINQALSSVNRDDLAGQLRAVYIMDLLNDLEDKVEIADMVGQTVEKQILAFKGIYGTVHSEAYDLGKLGKTDEVMEDLLNTFRFFSDELYVPEIEEN